MMPLFDAINIAIGTASTERTGNSIIIEKIDCSYSFVEDYSNNPGPDEIRDAASANKFSIAHIITDPRFRVMVVTPK